MIELYFFLDMLEAARVRFNYKDSDKIVLNIITINKLKEYNDYYYLSIY